MQEEKEEETIDEKNLMGKDQDEIEQLKRHNTIIPEIIIPDQTDIEMNLKLTILETTIQDQIDIEMMEGSIIEVEAKLVEIPEEITMTEEVPVDTVENLKIETQEMKN